MIQVRFSNADILVLTLNQRVVGSSPTGGTFKFFGNQGLRFLLFSPIDGWSVIWSARAFPDSRSCS